MLQSHIATNMTNEELIKYVNRDNVEVNELCKRIEVLLDGEGDSIQSIADGLQSTVHGIEHALGEVQSIIDDLKSKGKKK